MKCCSYRSRNVVVDGKRPEEAKKIAAAFAKVAPDKQAGARIRMIQSAIQREGLRSVPTGVAQGV